MHRYRQTDWQIDRQTNRNSYMHKCMPIYRQTIGREGEKEKREKEREGERRTKKVRETEAERERQTDRKTETERSSEGECEKNRGIVSHLRIYIAPLNIN